LNLSSPGDDVVRHVAQNVLPAANAECPAALVALAPLCLGEFAKLPNVDCGNNSRSLPVITGAVSKKS
jgi:hypothetical protein